MPFIVFVCFIGMFVVALRQPPYATDKAPSPIDFSALEFKSINTGASIAPPTRGIYIISLFASWCQGCRIENTQLIAFSRARPDIPIYGLLWMDSMKNGAKFLQSLGNPYKDVAIISDVEAVSLGATGIPEIFIVENNKLIYHMRGEISAKRLNYAIQEVAAKNGAL